MTEGTVELALRLTTYVVLLLAVPLAFVALFRLVNYLALDDVTERHAAARQDLGRPPTGEDESDGDDGVRCPTCGTRNGSTYTFCRRCQSRIGV